MTHTGHALCVRCVNDPPPQRRAIRHIGAIEKEITLRSQPKQSIKKLPFTRRAKRLSAALALACIGFFGTGVANAQSPTLDAITKRGELLCSGATVNSPGFAVVDAKGAWTGLDVDICRAL